MKLWVSNPLWALHWFGPPSNWLRSTPQSLLEAFITHCHVSDCTQGFPTTVCKCTARISVEIRPWGVGLWECFSVFSFEFLTKFKDVCPLFCRYYTAHKITHCPFRLTTVLSAVCIQLLNHKLFFHTSGTNKLNLLYKSDWLVNIF